MLKRVSQRSTEVSSALDTSELSRFFKGLGDDTRVRIIALLAHGELCVCHVEAALELTQPTASRQLSILKNAGLVESRRRATWVYYQLKQQADPSRQAQLDALVTKFRQDEKLKATVKRLLRTSGPNACVVRDA